jgi:flagellar biogenesis protein FliO
MNVLGLLGMLVVCAFVIALAAAITWLVVRFSPAKRPNQSAS